MATITEPKKENHRRSRRGKARSTVKLHCRSGACGLGPNLATMVLDISDSGVRLVVTRALEFQSEVEIVINGYGLQEPIKRVGNVRWQLQLEGGEFGVGIQFQKPLDYRDWQQLVLPG